MNNVYRVSSLNKVDVTRYIEGDMFLTKRSIGILLDGNIEIINKTVNLKDYVKKKDVEQMIDERLKGVQINEKK